MAKQFGTMPDGSPVWLCEIKGGGVTVEIITYGATLHRILAPDRKGAVADVILGKDDLAGYMGRGALAGATIGRVANRIKGHSFKLDGKRVNLSANENKNTLHGGPGNYARKNFALIESDESHVRLATRDTGEGGFPGEIAVEVCYRLDGDGTLLITYMAVPEEDTPLNLTNHVYFNLAGQGSGLTVDGQKLMINADFYTPTDKQDIPTGEVYKTRKTPFDFSQPRALGDAMAELAKYGDWHGGFDHNFVLNGTGWRKAAEAVDDTSGRAMEVYTDLPAVQLYTANKTGAAATGKDGATYQNHSGFCLETQFFPDTVHRPHFPDCVAAAGEVFATSTAYRFFVK